MSNKFDDIRVKFDVACALAAISQQKTLSITLPKTLTADNVPLQILQDCIQPDSFEKSGCKIRAALKSDQHELKIGDDTLKLAPGGDIFVGGSGVTAQLHDEKINRYFAFKVPRASVLFYQPTDLLPVNNNVLELSFSNDYSAFEKVYAAFANEKLISRRLTHENVARHFHGDKKIFENSPLPNGLKAEFPFSVSEWIDGARKLHTYLYEERENLALPKVVSLITDTFAALTHVHKRKVLHWDIKSDNLLISKNGVPKIIDFGNGKLLDAPQEKDRIVITTEGKYPDLEVFEKKTTPHPESRRITLELPDISWNHPVIDCWMLAQEWNRCLEISPDFLNEELRGKCDLDEKEGEGSELRKSVFDERYPRAADIAECLRLIFDRILFPFHKNYFSKFNNNGIFDPTELYYRTTNDVEQTEQIVHELSRVLPPFGAGKDVPELLVTLDDIVRLPVTGNSVFTGRIAAIADSEVVKPTRLHHQLAQVWQVFPGATHSRFEHLLGTVTTTAYFIRSLYLNEMNGFWRVSADATDIAACLLASILHDVGHLAFGHFIEEMDDLLPKHTDYTLQIIAECLKRLKNQHAPHPESLENVQSSDDTDKEISDLISRLNEHWVSEGVQNKKHEQIVVLLNRVAAIFNAGYVQPKTSIHLSRSGTRAALDSILKSIIDGPMDADKLDYLRRDAHHAGVFFAGGIDLERFFESLRVCVNTSENPRAFMWTKKGDIPPTPAIGVSDKGIAPAETIITARYHLFSVVYWHRTTRCITSMLQRVISEIRLLMNDEDWANFISGLLKEFRCRDDRRALSWLKGELDRRTLSNQPLSGLDEGIEVKADCVKIGDVVDGLLESRKEYFGLAFELGYMGPVDPNSRAGMSPRERLHKAICDKLYLNREAEFGEVSKESNGRQRREDLRQYRRELENAFEATLESVAHKKFKVDTILLDVPEPAKDQIKGFFVDRRSKRSRLSKHYCSLDVSEAPPDFMELTLISPIAASLQDVFAKWARKVRIYMTKSDLKELEDLGFIPGDVAMLWQKALYDLYDVKDERQFNFRELD